MPVAEAFGQALAELWMRDGISVDEPVALANAVAATFAEGDEGAKAAATLLARSGVRAQWNRVLRHDRARALASRVHPLVVEPVVDVLCGDGSVCEALSELGVSRLAATERGGEYDAYGQSRLPTHVHFQPFADDLDLAQFNASTALVSAVLHHERRPVHLLDALARAGIPQWIVIENCVSARFPRAFHELADRFFNTCLNDIGIHCGDEHRTRDQWVDLLHGYGDVTVVADAFDVPGIPFDYTLMVVRRRSIEG